MHVIARGKFFSKLRNFHIHDSLNEKIGRVGDLLLRKEDLSVYALISHDSHFKERLESIGILNDRDEIIPLHHINRDELQPNQITTTIHRRKLRTTDRSWEIPEEYFMFSKLCKLEVFDKDGDSVGRITDIIYHEDDEYSIVIDPASYIQHFLEVLHLRHHHEIILSGNYIGEITDDAIQLTIDRQEIEEIDALPIHIILDKDRGAQNHKSDKLKKRYHYKILQAPIYEALEKLENKGSKLKDAKSKLKIVSFDSQDELQVQQFVTLFNEVAITSVDPYEHLTEDKVRNHFGNGSYLAYYLDNPVGYCITTEEKEKKIGAIAGIGIHHKFRGKRFSTAIMASMLEKFDQDEMEFIQCDVLSKNEASLGLFHGLGFKEIDDFYLT